MGFAVETVNNREADACSSSPAIPQPYTRRKTTLRVGGFAKSTAFPYISHLAYRQVSETIILEASYSFKEMATNAASHVDQGSLRLVALYPFPSVECAGTDASAVLSLSLMIQAIQLLSQSYNAYRSNRSQLSKVLPNATAWCSVISQISFRAC